MPGSKGMSEDSEAPEFSNERGESATDKGSTGINQPGARDKVYDLVDIVDDLPVRIHDLTDIVEEPEPRRSEEPQEVLVIDGRGYEKEPQPEEKIHDLVHLVEENPLPVQPQGLSPEEMRKIIVETVERMAREMLPDIAERVIREEIEKLKREAQEEIV
jgi:hypothetical protein